MKSLNYKIGFLALIWLGTFLPPPALSKGVRLWDNLFAGMTIQQAKASSPKSLTCEKYYKETICVTKPFLSLGEEVAFLKLYFPNSTNLKSVRIWVDKKARCGELFSNKSFPLTIQEHEDRRSKAEACSTPFYTNFDNFSRSVVPALEGKYGKYSVIYGDKTWHYRGIQIQLQHKSAGEFGVLYQEDHGFGKL
jgi:hypothetical protein